MIRLKIACLLMFLPFVTGCAGCANDWKHFQSNTFGLTRKVTLYNASGEPIREWETENPVELRGGDAWFINSKGKTVTISGTFVVEEE